MNQVVKEINDIKRMKDALLRTSSSKLKNDYTKAIKRKTREVKEYCGYKNIDYNSLLKEI